MLTWSAAVDDLQPRKFRKERIMRYWVPRIGIDFHSLSWLLNHFVEINVPIIEIWIYFIIMYELHNRT